MRATRLLVLALALASSASAATAHAQGEASTSRTLPAPGGHFAVGTTVYPLVDQARTEPVGGWAGRRLMLQLWYPAARGKGAPAAYIPDAGALDSMLARGYNRLDAAELRPLGALRTHALRDAAPLTGERRPVLVLSHGHGLSRSNYTALAEELASRGFLVAALDHPYGGFIVLPDGRALTLADEVADVNDPAVLSARTLEWAGDASFVLDQLGDARSAPGRRFARVADVARAGMLGHSFGGAAALEACRLDRRLLACADLDGMPFGPVREQGTPRPTLVMLSQPDYSDHELAEKGRTRAQWEAMGRMRYAAFDSIFTRSPGTPGYVVEIRGAAHLSFSDAPFVLPSMITRFGGTPIVAVRGHALVSGYLGDFFDRYLRGGAGARLDAAQQEPEVRRMAYGSARPRLSLTDCRVADSVPARCGHYRVYEDRTAGAGREIDLNLVVVPAERGAPAADAVFILAGGPGQVATELVPSMLRRLAGVRRDRDLVFIDQRGTGGSNPLLCPNQAAGGSGYGPEHDAYWSRCLAALGQTADVRHYTTAVAVDDFDEVRSALGYARVDLIGGSYGTRVAQRYLARHPERVRSAVLWAVAPAGYDIPVQGGLAVQHALERLLADCRADAACGQAYPRLDVRLDSLLAALGDTPRRVSLPAAAGEDSLRVEVTPELFAQAVLTLLYDAGHMRRLPALIERTARGDWAPIARIVAQIQAAQETSPDALYLAVVCAEDMPLVRPERLAEFHGRFGALLRRSAEGLAYRCAHWPKAVLAAGASVPVRSSAPVLLLSGEADPATPPGGAEHALDYLSNARHIVVPATSHGPFLPGCVPEVVAAFFERPEPARLDTACVQELNWAPFAVPGG